MPTGKNGGPLGGRFLAATANYIDERTSLSGFVKELGRKIFPDHWSFMLGEIALWSFVVVLLSGTFLTFFFQASMVPTHYTGAYLPDARRRDVGGPRLDAAALVRHPRRSARASDPPLGRARLRRRHRRAHAPRVLHRRVPQAARAQLADRLHPLRPRDGRGLHRLLAARRPALGQRPPHHRRHPQGHAPDRHVGVVPLLRRRVPRQPDRRAPLHAAHPAAAGDPRRSAGACT